MCVRERMIARERERQRDRERERLVEQGSFGKKVTADLRQQHTYLLSVDPDNKVSATI